MRTIPEAAELLDLIKSMQDAGRTMPCPRCGHERMNNKLTMNSLSRYADIYICNDCGMQEAMMDMAGRCLPLNEWSVVKSFDRANGVTTEIKSDNGFYIGDICYVLDEKLYYEVWGGQHGFQDGCYTDPITGFQFAVASTENGDGCYEDDHGNCYGVDAGVIGLVPLELVTIVDPDSVGTVVREPGAANFDALDGKFTIQMPGGRVFTIDTAYDSDEEEGDDDDY